MQWPGKAIHTQPVAESAHLHVQDPACGSYSAAHLFYKGYHALQTHRIANGLWQRGQRVLAEDLQYRRGTEHCPWTAFLSHPTVVPAFTTH